MLRIGVLVSGGGTNLQAIIDAVAAGRLDAEITAVVSSRKDAYALERAKNAGIESFVVLRKNMSDKALLDIFEPRKTEVIVTAGFMTILGSEFLKHYENRIVNIHPSLIPSFCGQGMYGLRVHEAVLAAGVKLTGATVSFVNEITDGGPIIMQKAVPVMEGDTPETLQLRVMEQAERVILPEALQLISEGRVRVAGNRTVII